MSFGLRDEDWIEPDPVQAVKCRECDDWDECPCGCGYGWCFANKEFTHEDEECEQ